MLRYINKIKIIHIYYGAWLIALTGTLVSLYYSLIIKLPVCDLCWYQRILMYPLALIIPVGLVRLDKNLPYYVLPLTIAGAVIALYQSLLQWGIIKETLQCTSTTSCALAQVSYYGFITIPFLSLLAFCGIILCMVLAIRKRT
ncbi:disulfide bond formation protein B [Candidatus Berkelbacteria bacterium]|nr:disulfide bond formation protein B [Candidatus Berkelbacteria bacterium]